MSTEWIYATDEMGQTPLDRALHSSHMALMELLLRQEAEDDMLNLDGSSLLHKAAFLGLHEAVKSILADGGDVNGVDKHGETPLHKAAREGHYEAANLLIQHGANVNAVNNLGMTPLHWVSLNGRNALAALLVDAGADPDLCDEYLDRLTPLDLANIMGYSDIVYILERRDLEHT